MTIWLKLLTKSIVEDIKYRRKSNIDNLVKCKASLLENSSLNMKNCSPE